MNSTICPSCSLEIAPRLQACPSCGWLVFGDRLKELARLAETAEKSGELLAAVQHWREALELLPAGSRQLEIVTAKVEALSRQLEKTAAPTAQKAPNWATRGGVIGTIGLLLFKFKGLLVLALTKGKLLLLGLTKSSTLFSMLASAGVYWTLWGWQFAFGLVVAIYVHEMGHVVALQRLGIRASAPMFIPGLGAFVRLKQYPASAREDARVGLAGPLWGLGASLAFYLAFLATGWGSLGGIARFSAWINLFNLLPVWQLDGGRGMRALSRVQRFGVAATMAAMWAYTREGLLVLLTLFAGIRLFTGELPAEPDRKAFGQFVFLVIALALLAAIEVPGLAPPT